MLRRRPIYARMATAVQLFTVLIALFKIGVAVDPTIDIPEPEVKGGVTDIMASKNGHVDMVCVVENKPTDTNVMWLLWREADQVLKMLTTGTTSLEPSKYAIFKPTTTSWRLRVQNLKEEDEGLYRCRVETQPKTYISRSRFVRVVEIPQIDSLQTSSDKVVKEGKELSLDCNASGRPNPVIVWTRLANADLPNGGKELRNTHLYVAESRPEHRGKYLCRAQNIAGNKIRFIDVKVRFHPRVTADEKIVAQKMGYTKQLLCDITAYPEPEPTQVGWTGPSFSENDPNFKVTVSKGANNRVTTKLVIHRVRAQDYGDYICSGTNAEGDGDYTITLEPSDTPTTDRAGLVAGVTVPSSFNFLTLMLMFAAVILLHHF